MNAENEGQLDRHPSHPPPKTRLWLWVGAVGIVVVIIIAALLFTFGPGEGNGPHPHAPPLHPEDEPADVEEQRSQRPTLPTGGGSPIESH